VPSKNFSFPHIPKIKLSKIYMCQVTQHSCKTTEDRVQNKSTEHLGHCTLSSTCTSHLTGPNRHQANYMTALYMLKQKNL